jgi:hypothetical protein
MQQQLSPWPWSYKTGKLILPRADVVFASVAAGLAVVADAMWFKDFTWQNAEAKLLLLNEALSY